MESTPLSEPGAVSFSFEIGRQPNDTTCGPTCLQAVYRYYGLPVEMDDLLRDIPTLEHGGTLTVMLGLHALRHGFQATLYTYNLRFFDPSWFSPEPIVDLAAKLRTQVRIHPDGKRNLAAQAYLEFIQLGGKVIMEDLSPDLLIRHLSRKQPILTGLSSTWLYQSKREHPVTCLEDDIHGAPAGHFVVINGYNPSTHEAHIADPFEYSAKTGQRYSVPLMRLTNAVLLGILTYDANLLVIQPCDQHAHSSDRR
ncbi:MAG: C39 family peptidase [Verrucomicrobiaceae bacterium]